ncbi:sensor histidine kinase [Streptomyces erythrochromogenes]|uniref:sensor histidine kinase n=1 Tax=Streptomyces erythrochromogenes TaxID=285574 RepID=UPI002253F1C8|nr:histidine kinase [Streptomyces erythrochromogenes]MCX5585597.1 histidine kinase [Streptomyces erythrochromogenes]
MVPLNLSPRAARVRPVAETAGAGLAGLGVYGVVGHLGFLPYPALQLAALAAGTGIFALRRRLPGAALLVLAALTGLVPAVGPVTAAAAYSVARRMARPRLRARLLACAGLLLVVCATAAGPWLGPGSAAYGLALGLALAPTAVIVPGLIGTAQGQQGRLLRALRERGDAAERARRLADSEARIHERSRIAAEMHDLVGHRLSLVSLHAGGLELALERAAPELREEAVLVRRTTRDAMRELRQALGVLGPLGRDTGPDALTDATGTRADIEALVAQSRDGGIAVRLDWTGPDLDARPAPVRRAVHRVVREALTNVHRYAPDAHVGVTVVHDDARVRVTVRNGTRPGPPAPADEPGTGRGLTGLRERVELLGGTFEAAALPSGGFRVDAAVPAQSDGDPATGRTPAGPDTHRPPSGADPSGTQPSGTHPSGTYPAAAAGPDGRRTAEALTLGFGLAALSALMVVGIAFVYAAQPSGRSGPAPLPRVGMTYGEVAALGVQDNGAVRAAATGHEPPRPAGTAGCVYPFNGATERRPGGLLIARYCFDAAQRLIAIDRFDVPSVRDATPWEIP